MSTVTAPPVPGCLVMTDRAVVRDLGDREAGGGPRSGISVNTSSCRRWPGAALDDVAATTAPARRSKSSSRPAEVRRRGSHDHRCVGDPAGDDDVGARVQAPGDAPRPEVGVRRSGVPVQPAGRARVRLPARSDRRPRRGRSAHSVPVGRSHRAARRRGRWIEPAGVASRSSRRGRERAPDSPRPAAETFGVSRAPGPSSGPAEDQHRQPRRGIRRSGSPAHRPSSISRIAEIRSP